jgi:hypothetical protein
VSINGDPQKPSSRQGRGDKDIQALFRDGREIDRALREAVREAVLMHKKMGWPIVEWRDGKVVWTPADEIVVSEFPEPEISDVLNPEP